MNTFCKQNLVSDKDQVCFSLDIDRPENQKKLTIK